MNGNILIKPSVQQKFDHVMQSGRILFFSAPCGFGKTVVANALLRKWRTLCLRADAPDFSLQALPDEWDILLIDDFQLLQEQETSQTLCELIRANPARRFVFLSRGVPPAYLTAFQYTGLMTTLEPDDLLFDHEDIRNFFASCKVAVTESEINGILKESIGYPLGVAITARQMSDGKPFSPELTAHTYREVFAYFEAAVYNRFDLPVRRLLLELSLFEDFDMEMVRMVSGDPRAGERMDWLLRHTTMLRYDSRERFHFWAGFRAFLLWEMDREYTEEKRKALFSRGGLYYELKEDYAHALECYTQGGDHTRVAELLVRNADLHPGMGHYHAVIHRALKYAVKTDLIDVNPADKVDRPKKNEFTGNFYSKDEMNALFDAVRGSKIEVAVMLTAFYGLRRSEVVGLKWAAVDFEQNTIEICHTVTTVRLDGKEVLVESKGTKTKSSKRTLPLVPVFRERILALQEEQKENRKLCGRCYNKKYADYICIDAMGNLLKPDYLSNSFQIILQNYHLRRIRFHDLRHSCASLLLANGVPMKMIQEWLGHSDFSTTANIYSHLDYASKVSSAEAMLNGLGMGSNPGNDT